jgi:hypothetical protein
MVPRRLRWHLNRNWLRRRVMPQVALWAHLRKDGPMSEEPLRLRPFKEADLDPVRRFDTDPSTRGPYLSSRFRSPTLADAAGRRTAARR